MNKYTQKLPKMALIGQFFMDELGLSRTKQTSKWAINAILGSFQTESGRSILFLQNSRIPVENGPKETGPLCHF